MAFPTKTSREEIFLTAIEIVEREGIKSLSMREIAKRLNLVPNALYHHFKDRAEIEAEIAAAGFRRLTKMCQKSVGETTGSEAVVKSSFAFLEFAREQPELYKIMFKFREPTPVIMAAITELQEFNNGTYGELNFDQKMEEAQYAIFAMLHGIVTLTSEGILEENLGFNLRAAILALLTKSIGDQ